MANTLAKLTRPKVHRVVARERLFRRLDTARDRALIWIGAPPGSGKTTLVASYLDARKIKAVWYQVDGGDDDLGTFFHYLTQGLPAARSRQGDLPVPTPEHLGDLAAYCRLYFRRLFDRLPAGAVLVLDNYHELPRQSGLHAVLGHAVAELPEGLNVIVISRTDPPRELLKVKAAEQLDVLDWEQLRLTFEETRAVAAARLKLDEAALRQIHRVADGWAAGITLTLQRTLPDARPALGSHEAREDLFEYFATQILDAASAATRDFLTLTALLPDMTAELADRMTGRDDSEAVLDDLYRRGLFLDRRGTRPCVYHYHDLFRAFLVEQLERGNDADRLVEWRRKAAGLIEETDRKDQAIELYLGIHAWDDAKRTILAVAPGLTLQGRGAPVFDWISALPPEVISADPRLDYWRGAALARSAPTEARVHYERAYATFQARQDVQGQRLVCAEIIFTYMYEYADFTPLDAWIAALLALLEQQIPFHGPTAELHVQTALLFGLGFRKPVAGPLQACAARVTELVAAEVPPDLAAVAEGVLVMLAYQMGDLTGCQRAIARLRKLQESGRLSPVSQAVSAMHMGHGALRSGNLTAARDAYAQSLAIGEQNAISLTAIRVYCNLGLALCALDQRDLTAAEGHRKQIERHWVASRRIDENASLRLQLWIACHRGRHEVALELAQRQVAIAQAGGLFLLVIEAQILLALTCAELGRAEELEAALAPVAPMIEGTTYAHYQYLPELVRSYHALLHGSHDAALRLLRSGLEKSRGDQGLFVLRMHANVLSRLLSEALSAGIESGYVVHMIRELRIRHPDSVTPAWPWPLKVHTLGRFEILRDEQPLEFSRKAPRKTLALLKAIIAFGGRNVREQVLLDAFWSDEEGDAANRSMTAALHRLRALLGDSEAVVQQGGMLSLAPDRVWVDVWAFEEQVARAGEVDRLLSLYRGSFLAEEEGEPWSVMLRERLRGKFIHALVLGTRHLEAVDRCDAAIECYLRGIDADPVIEQFYQGLMRCYARLDRKAEALAAYRRLRQVLSVHLSLKPAASTEKLYQALKLGAA